MVAYRSIKKLIRLAAVPFAAFAVMAASPASAKSEATSVQISSAVRAADDAQAPLGTGDEEFRDLFASWKSLDDGLGTPSVSHQKVAVPSRMPVDGVTLTSSYGMRDHPILRQRRAHKGVDLAGPTGTPVYATADGLVSMAQWFSSYGKYVQIEHGSELQTRYAHLSDYIVEPGQRVQKGDLIGYIGSTGRSTGPHLHYEVRVNGEAVNPIPYMTESSAQEQFALVAGNGGQGGPE